VSAAVKCWWVLRRVGGAARRAVTRSAAASSAPGVAAMPRPRVIPRPRVRHALVLVCAAGVPGAALLVTPSDPPAAPSALPGAGQVGTEAAWRLAILESQAATHPVAVPVPGAALLLATAIVALIAARRI
jgi:hypothetical protein